VSTCVNLVLCNTKIHLVGGATSNSHLKLGITERWSATNEKCKNALADLNRKRFIKAVDTVAQVILVLRRYHRYIPFLGWALRVTVEMVSPCPSNSGPETVCIRSATDKMSSLETKAVEPFLNRCIGFTWLEPNPPTASDF
jgi:hypothetical protein